MKALKITTRETDKLRDEIQQQDLRIAATEEHQVASDFNIARIFDMKAARIETISTLSALIDAKSAAINAALDNVNGKAVAHTVNTYAEVWAIADRAEQLLAARGVTKGHRVGTTVVFSPSGPGASAYKYAAISTVVELRRVADGWRLIGASRCSAWPKSAETFNLTISPEAADNITATAFESITVRTAEKAAA